MARRLAQLAHIPVTELHGVGAERARSLTEHLEIESVLDLLTHYPRRYIDRTHQARIRDLKLGEEAMVLARVQRIASRRTRGRPPKVLVTADIKDATGSLRVSFFNQQWRAKQLPAGTEAVFFGKVDAYRGQRQMTNPVVDLIGDRTGRIVPVYPQSEKARVHTWDLARWIEEALRRAGEFVDPVPEWVLDKFDLVDRTAAFRGIHLPSSPEEHKAARRRLVLDELLRLQLALVERKRHLERTTRGITHGRPGRLVAQLWDRLPFDPTPDQRQAIDEIAADLAKPHPMHRLLQGDVGSGKTLVGVAALLVAVEGGHQGAFMAPTEVLAEQHAQGIRALVDGMALGDGGTTLFGERPLRAELLTNRVPASDRRRILEELAAGQVDLVIGTHALIQEDVRFRSLGVVVIDEQHRFGVEQRAALRDKAGDAAAPVPDVLVMTATPIPRTAAMTVYGDLDVTIIRSRPAGRQPITTRWARTAEDETEVWDAVRREVAAGRQAYVVCPLIEESDRLEARSAEDTYAELEAGELAGLRLGLLHGRLSPADKDATMHQFREGRLDMLVATTVIEVGVDVPNATVMVILDADRFGIAQLHQLRGRVGRGSERSWCYLVSQADTPEAEARLSALEASTDGFELAEVDLDLRGEGTIMGERQKGRNDLKLASLRRDRDWVEHAREVALAIVDGTGDAPGPEGPAGLAAHPALLDEVTLFLDEDEQEFLLKG